MRPLLAALGLLLAMGCTGGSASESSSPVPSGPPTSDLRIGLLEYRLALSSGALVTGPVTITVTNAGTAQHDVRLRQGGRVIAASELLSPGGRQVLRVVIDGGAPVELDCTVRGHARAGMRASLAVAG